MKTWTDCSRELRELGYNHTAGNHFGRLNGKKKIDRARIIAEPDGNHRIEEQPK